jgi:Metallo-peptidase family M12B Reprolysin-like/Cadherin-like
MRKLIIFVWAAITCIAPSMAQKTTDYWTPVAAEAITIPEKALPMHVPAQFRAYRLDYASMLSTLAAAPQEGSAEIGRKSLEIALPLPDGQMETFTVVAYDVLMPKAAARFPQIRSYYGHAVDNPAMTVRITTSPDWGLQAFFRRPDKTIAYIETAAQGQTTFYRAYEHAHFNPEGNKAVACGNDHEMELEAAAAQSRPTATPVQPVESRGNLKPVVLKIYRFACATTGEFSIDHGGTTASVLAAMVNYTAQLNAIYEADLTLRLKIVDDIDKILFMDPATDPYTGSTVFDWANQNPSAMLTFLGTADKYDMGHVFARYMSGPAIGVANGRTCTQFKGRACSAGRRGVYGTDFFNTFGHEIGHQWSAGHTWNNCPGSENQFAPNSACEPGSGTTMMSYSGSCGNDNISSSSFDLYYTACSVVEIRRFVEQQEGNTCGLNETLGHSYPELNLSYKSGFAIPISTPFELTGVATDADNDRLTYTWEQIDRGPQSPLGSPKVVEIGNPPTGAPAFRSLPPGPSPTRTFPSLPVILSNSSSRTEVLPTVSRRLTFALTVRDNRAGGAGVTLDTVWFQSTAQAGPFVVTSPNEASVRWEVGRHEVVTWNVANTDRAPVNCQKVNVKMSLDGGQTFPVTLASGVPNIGRACITVPNSLSNAARIRVEAADNIFFDISNTFFNIVAPTRPGFSMCASELSTLNCPPATYSVNLSTLNWQGFSTPIALNATGLPAGATATFEPTTITPGNTGKMTLSYAPSTPEGTYNVVITGTSAGITATSTVAVTVVQNNLSAIALQSPANGVTGVSTETSAVLRWSRATDADNYDVQFATNPSFKPEVIRAGSANVTADSFRVPVTLEKGAIYYWRVRGKNACGEGAWVGPFAFVTGAESCQTYTATDLPKNITTNGTPTVESRITVPSGGTISDVNIKNIRGNHSLFRQLEVRLVKAGTPEVSALLWTGRCAASTITFNIGFDDGAASAFTTQCPPATGANFRPAESFSVFRGQQAAGDWILRVRDNQTGDGGSIAAFQLELCAAGGSANPPIIVVNNLLRISGGGNEPIVNTLLRAEDANNGPQQLTFTLMTLPEFGRLEKNGVVLGLGDTFTQADLNSGAVRYFDGNNATRPDNFRFSVTDGEGGLAVGQFNIASLAIGTKDISTPLAFALAPNPADEVTRLTFGETLRSETRVMLFDVAGRQLDAWTVASGSAELLLRVGHLPKGIYTVQARNATGTGSKVLAVH